jgi:hypothetical protein
MVNRRTTLKIGAASIISSLVHAPARSLASTASKTVTLHSHALFDSQFIESTAFANALKSQNIITTDINGDLSNLWYGQLRNQLLAEPKPIFGLTDRLDLFCLEELARDVGMKVSLRFDHLIHQNGFVEHQLNGSPLMNSSQENLGNTAGFGNKMAELAELFLNDQFPEISAQKLTGPYAPLNKTALVTWVIS